MKIAFINPSLRPDSKRRQLPVGLAYIMTAADKAGYEFDLIDMDINNMSMEAFEAVVSQSKYTLYALGCIVTGYKFVKSIVDIIKKINPEAIIVAGNSVASSIPEILLQDTKVDIAVMGEGDITFIELLENLSKGNEWRDIKGIAFKDHEKICVTPSRSIIPHLDSIGFPNWKLFELEKYNKYASINVNDFSSQNVLSYPLNSARGCPYNCTFCYHVFKGHKYRRYSEDAIIQEIERLHYEFGCDFISFWDELTFPTIKSVEALTTRIGKLNFKIAWEAPVRGDLFKREHIDLIRQVKATGCENLAFSLENASPEILAAMNKKMDVAQFVEQAKALRAGGVIPLTSLIFGYPQETPQTIQKTLDVCEECGIFPSVGFLLPLPGTPIYEWAKGTGHIGDEVAYLERIGDRQDFHINLTAMSDDELLSTVETKLRVLAEKQGLQLDSVFKTVTYQKPKEIPGNLDE